MDIGITVQIRYATIMNIGGKDNPQAFRRSKNGTTKRIDFLIRVGKNSPKERPFIKYCYAIGGYAEELEHWINKNLPDGKPAFGLQRHFEIRCAEEERFIPSRKPGMSDEEYQKIKDEAEKNNATMYKILSMRPIDFKSEEKVKAKEEKKAVEEKKTVEGKPFSAILDVDEDLPPFLMN